MHKNIYKIIVITSLLSASQVAEAKDAKFRIRELANRHNLNASPRVLNAIINASERWGVDTMDLATLAIIETQLGNYRRINKNNNGTIDVGLFQINTINHDFCIEYNLSNDEGSAMCAAKIIKRLKIKQKSDIAKFHSKTPSKKKIYWDKFQRIMVQK